MVVQHNMTAINANRYFGINNNKLSKSLEKLSSGYAINRAGDNAAGLAVSEKMRSQIAGINQGVKNAQDGISMVQTYEGALTETDSILQRMKTLATQSANGSYDNAVDRNAIEQEFLQLNDELDQIADTDFNGVCVLNGGYTASNIKLTGAPDKKFEIALDSNSVAVTPDTNSTADGEVAFTYENGQWTASKGDVDPSSTATSITYSGHTFTIDPDKTEISGGATFTAKFTKGSAAVVGAGAKTLDKKNGLTYGAGATVDFTAATKTVTGATLKYSGGAWKVALADGTEQTMADFNTNYGVDLTALTDKANYTKDGGGTVDDSDVQGTEHTINITTAKADAVDATATIKDKTAVSVSNTFKNGDSTTEKMTYVDHIILQVGGRSKDAVNFTFKYSSDGIGSLKSDLNCTSQGLGTAGLSLSSQDKANQAVDRIEYAINKVSMVRGTFGAIQNRLEHKIDNMNVTSENLTAAESRIRDTDMATEMMNFTKNQILSQASQSMLAQANQLPQGVLSLLQ